MLEQALNITNCLIIFTYCRIGMWLEQIAFKNHHFAYYTAETPYWLSTIIKAKCVDKSA